MTTLQTERAIGLSAITGTSLVAMKVVMYAYRSIRGDTKSSDEFSDSSTELSREIVVPKQTRTASYSVLGIFRRTLRRILLDESEYIARAPSSALDDAIDGNDDAEGPLVIHQGSCHCESIQFTVLAPRVLTAQDGPGKIQFRHTQVKASNFRVYAGFDSLKTYYVAYRDSGNKGAHAFCERCGVHVLYAPSKSTPYVSINVRCLRSDESVKIKLTSKKDGISDGIPIAGQFENASNSDQLSTISEVTQPFHFQMNYVNPKTPEFQQFPNRRGPSQQYPGSRSVARQASGVSRRASDISSMESSVSSDEGNIEVPIKQFYATTTRTTNAKENHLSRTTSSTIGTESITTTTEADSSGSLYRGHINELEMMSPARSGSANFAESDDFSFTGVSLMDDQMSVSSPAAKNNSSTIKLRVVTGGEGNKPPRHATVTSPETRNKMKYFMSKYKKQGAK